MIVVTGCVTENINLFLKLASDFRLQPHTHTHLLSWGKSVQGGIGAMRLTLCKAPTSETRPDHYTGNSVPYSGFTTSAWVL